MAFRLDENVREGEAILDINDGNVQIVDLVEDFDKSKKFQARIKITTADLLHGYYTNKI